MAGYAWLVAAAPAGASRARSARWPRSRAWWRRWRSPRRLGPARARSRCSTASARCRSTSPARAAPPRCSEYPNLAAGVRDVRPARGVGLLAARGGAALAARRPSPRCWARGLLFTYSRGALVAAALRAAGAGARSLACARRARRGPAVAGRSACWPCAPPRSRGRARSSACASPARARAAGTARRYEPAEAALHLRPGELRTTHGARDEHRAEDLDAWARHFHLVVPLVRTWTGSCWRTASARACRATSGPGESALLEAIVRAPATAGPATCWSGTWSTSTRPGSAARASRRAWCRRWSASFRPPPAPEPSVRRRRRPTSAGSPAAGAVAPGARACGASGR